MNDKTGVGAESPAASTGQRPGAADTEVLNGDLGREADETNRRRDGDGAPTGDQPDSPTEVSGRTWKYVARRTWREFKRDECMDNAAALTYYAVLSVFPAIIALLSLVSLFGQQDRTVQAIEQLAQDLQVPAAEEVITPALEALNQAPAGPGLALLLGLGTALWSASGYVGAFGRTMNRIYEIREGRPFWKLRPLLLLVTLVAITLAATVALAMALSGPVAQAVGSALGLGDTAVTVWSIAKWPVILLVVMLIVAILYYATPNVRQPRFRWVSLGAVVAILTWIGATALFAVYVSNFASYDKVYGTLAGVVVFLLWLWLTNLALLFGAELNSELERGRELQGGIAAEEQLQLPPRDTKVLDKEAKQDHQDITEGRDLRADAEAEEDPQSRRVGS